MSIVNGSRMALMINELHKNVAEMWDITMKDLVLVTIKGRNIGLICLVSTEWE